MSSHSDAFEEDARYISSLKHEMHRLSTHERLRLYALYKIGNGQLKPPHDCPRATLWNTDRVSMWKAWRDANVSVEEAQHEYTVRTDMIRQKLASK